VFGHSVTSSGTDMRKSTLSKVHTASGNRNLFRKCPNAVSTQSENEVCVSK